MIGILLAHLSGDYLFQNSWMAREKTTRWLPAIVHALIYTACYVAVTRSVAALAVIGGTHLLIDRFRLVNWWIRAKEHGALEAYTQQAAWLTFWLMVIQDNTIHLLINTAAIRWL